MKLKQAIGVLETHNRWRRGEDVEPILKPSDIGIAIDTVVEYVKNNGGLDDVISYSYCDCDNDCKNLDCGIIKCKQGNKK